MVDPLPAPVRGESRGDTSAHAIALSPPLATEDALSNVHELLDAIVREDLAAVTTASQIATRSVWVNSANVVNGVPGAHPASDLVGIFRERFRRLDYKALAGVTLFRDADAEVATFDDLATPMPGRAGRPNEMQPGDVLVHVHVLTPRVGAERLFGDELTFLLREVRGRYRVAVLFEEFAMP